MTVVHDEEIWTDPTDGYTIMAARYPDDLETEEEGCIMAFSFHTGELWYEMPGERIRGTRFRTAHIGPLVKTHTDFSSALLDRGFRPDTHYLLGRKQGGFPLRIGSRPAVEELLAELTAEWKKYRRASNPEFRIKGLRAIRRAHSAKDSKRIAALKKRYPDAAEYDKRERRYKAKHLASSFLGSVRNAPTKSSAAVRQAVGTVTSGSRQAIETAVPSANGLLATTQGLLASALSTDLNAMVQNMVKGPATIYDKAMDAEFLANSIGGANHRMFDGGHTILGAIKTVRDASPDDTVIQEAMGFLESLFRDMSTPKGLPLANWDKATYEQVAECLKSNLGIPKDWFYDLNSYDAPELLGGVIGVVATVLSWNRAETEEFAKLVGGMGVSALFAANPLLLVVTVVALARAFHKAHHAGEYVEFVDGQLKGGIGAGASLAAASQIAVIGGPAGLALLAGLAAGVLVNMASQKVSVGQIGRFVAERARIAAANAKGLATR